MKQRKFIKLVSKESGYYMAAIKDILDVAQRVVEKEMAKADSDEQTSINIFEGLTLGTKYYPSKRAMNPRTGEWVTTEAHIYPTARYSKSYMLRVREACSENLEDEC